LSSPTTWRIFIVDTMKTRIQKWGNSLALRIPSAFARSLGLEQDSQVELTMTRTQLVIAPVRQPKPKLAELLDRITPANVHREVDAGKAQGRESW
jgi:antitoxin MazE